MAQLWMHDEGALALAMRYGGPFTAAGEKRHRNEGKEVSTSLNAAS